MTKEEDGHIGRFCAPCKMRAMLALSPVNAVNDRCTAAKVRPLACPGLSAQSSAVRVNQKNIRSFIDLLNERLSSTRNPTVEIIGVTLEGVERIV